MFPRRLPLTLAALGVLLAGCSFPTSPPEEIAPEKNQVEVERTLYSHIVEFERGDHELTAAARQRLQQFLRESGADRHATMVVTAAPTVPGELAERRRDTAVRFLREKGFRPKPEDDLLDPHPVAEADVLIRVARYHAVLADCPDYSRTVIGDYHNLPSSNFGCAYHSNLGLMVANPRDLLRGRGLAPADGERQSATIRAYREGEIPAITGEAERRGFAGDN